MKIIKGDYPGASTFAQFDKPVNQMTLKECQGLLEQILFRAMPGENNAEIMFKELELAEQLLKEQG